MALIVEDGTVVENANSYITLEYLVNYWALRGTTFTQDDETLINYIIKATQYIDMKYNFRGCSTEQEQDLSFPRLYLYDREGYLVIGIPKRLMKAVCESAKLLINGTNLFEAEESGVGAKSVTVGPIKTAYSYTNGNSVKKTYNSIASYLKDYVVAISYNANVRRY